MLLFAIRYAKDQTKNCEFVDVMPHAAVFQSLTQIKTSFENAHICHSVGSRQSIEGAGTYKYKIKTPEIQTLVSVVSMSDLHKKHPLLFLNVHGSVK